MKRTIIALGNFDGVHLGHQAVLRAGRARADALGLPLLAMTFEPHPRNLFRPDEQPFRLTPENEKVALLKNAGVDDVRVMNFTPEFAALSAEDFMTKILIGEVGAAVLVAGADFVFGHKRQGNMHMLADYMSNHNVEVIQVPAELDGMRGILSSTRIRDHLKAGEVDLAAQILSRPYTITGIVQHGDQRGRLLGFPTANVDMGIYQRPRYGVYAVKVEIAGKAHIGVANIGFRPTVNSPREWLEVHILDFDEDIYDAEMRTSLYSFLRPEQKFAGIEALKTQIAIDAQTSRKFFSHD